MDRAEFQAALLDVMERKVHWAWPMFTSGKVARARLHLHFEQEYAVYVRDFAVLIGRAYVQCPIAAVRSELAENLYEEETGGLSKSRAHAELFLEYPRGLGMDLSRFKRVSLLREAAAYRAFLDDATTARGWDVAAAVTTLFLEGTSYERGELDASAPKRPETPLEQHPLVVHYGLPVGALKLTKVHRAVEGGHRTSAWNIVLGHVEQGRRALVVQAMEACLTHWVRYRDDVASACGLVRDATRVPPRAVGD